MARTPTQCPGQDRIGRTIVYLAVLAVTWVSLTPANAAIGDQSGGELPIPVCHDEETMLLVAAQFGRVLVVTGEQTSVIVDAAWRMIEKRPPVANKLYVVIGRDGIVHLFAVNGGCVRRSMAATLQAFRTIFRGGPERSQEGRH